VKTFFFFFHSWTELVSGCPYKKFISLPAKLRGKGQTFTLINMHERNYSSKILTKWIRERWPSSFKCQVSKRIIKQFIFFLIQNVPRSVSFPLCDRLELPYVVFSNVGEVSNNFYRASWNLIMWPTSIYTLIDTGTLKWYLIS
jgi:hypothetical protein